MAFIRRCLVAAYLSSYALGQLPSSQCDSAGIRVEDCAYLTTDSNSSADDHISAPIDLNHYLQENFIATAKVKKQGFHWGRALGESFAFLAIEQAYVVHDDYRWVVVENGIPFNHYWHDYKQSLSAWANAGWNDGDPWLYSYVGHPIQGALTSYI